MNGVGVACIFFFPPQNRILPVRSGGSPGPVRGLPKGSPGGTLSDQCRDCGDGVFGVVHK